jgi:hypothetical protein
MQPGPAALFGPERLVGDRVVDHRGADVVPAPAAKLGFLHRDADREMRDAVEEVAGAVERIDDPARLVCVTFDDARLFHHETPVGACGEQFVIDRAFGDAVGLGNEIGRSLAADLEVLDLAKIAPQAATRLARGLLHYADDTR